jgi:hypothetical protein
MKTSSATHLIAITSVTLALTSLAALTFDDSAVQNIQFAHDKQSGCNLRSRMRQPDFYKSVRWVRDDAYGGSWQLKIRNCSLEISQSEAISCLRKHVPDGLLLIGDSVTRYQYLSLAYFLATGRWQSPKPTNVIEREFGSWSAFYNITNSRMGGAELCDCYRQEHTFNHITESRFFRKNGVSVTYLQMFNPPLIRVHDFDYIKTCSPFCSPNSTFSTNLNIYTSADTFAELISTFSQTFLNAGHWYREKHAVANLSHVLVPIAARTGGFHWKTTTYPGRRDDEVATMFDNVYDAHGLTQLAADTVPSLMWDRLHFNEAVYQGLNQALLSYVCHR